MHIYRSDRAFRALANAAHACGRVVLQVRDDGVGMPEGADAARPKSLGLEIVAILTRQLKGTFEIERGRGALCRVTFPESPILSHISRELRPNSDAIREIL